MGHVENFLEISNIREISPSLRRMGDLRADFLFFFLFFVVFFLLEISWIRVTSFGVSQV